MHTRLSKPRHPSQALRRGLTHHLSLCPSILPPRKAHPFVFLSSRSSHRAMISTKSSLTLGLRVHPSHLCLCLSSHQLHSTSWKQRHLSCDLDSHRQLESTLRWAEFSHCFSPLCLAEGWTYKRHPLSPGLTGRTDHGSKHRAQIRTQKVLFGRQAGAGWLWQSRPFAQEEPGSQGTLHPGALLQLAGSTGGLSSPFFSSCPELNRRHTSSAYGQAAGQMHFPQ